MQSRLNSVPIILLPHSLHGRPNMPVLQTTVYLLQWNLRKNFEQLLLFVSRAYSRAMDHTPSYKSHLFFLQSNCTSNRKPRDVPGTTHRLFQMSTRTALEYQPQETPCN